MGPPSAPAYDPEEVDGDGWHILPDDQIVHDEEGEDPSAALFAFVPAPPRSSGSPADDAPSTEKGSRQEIRQEKGTP